MSIMPDVGWILVEAGLEWGKLLAATYVGCRAIRAFERSRRGAPPRAPGEPRSRLRALRRRVRLLERTLRSVELTSTQVLEAQRFTTAVLTRPPSDRAVRAAHPGAAD